MEPPVGEAVWRQIIGDTTTMERGGRKEGVALRYPMKLEEAVAAYKKNDTDIDIEARRIASSFRQSFRAIDEVGHEAVAVRSSVLSSLRREIANPLIRHEVRKLLLSEEDEPRS